MKKEKNESTFEEQFSKQFKIFIYFFNFVPSEIVPYKMGCREYFTII